MNVDMTYDEKTELYSMPKKYIHETKQLLKQSLHDDQTVHYDASDDDEEVYSMADNDGGRQPISRQYSNKAIFLYIVKKSENHRLYPYLLYLCLIASHIYIYI